VVPACRASTLAPTTRYSSNRHAIIPEAVAAPLIRNGRIHRSGDRTTPPEPTTIYAQRVAHDQVLPSGVRRMEFFCPSAPDTAQRWRDAPTDRPRAVRSSRGPDRENSHSGPAPANDSDALPHGHTITRIWRPQRVAYSQGSTSLGGAATLLGRLAGGPARTTASHTPSRSWYPTALRRRDRRLGKASSVNRQRQTPINSSGRTLSDFRARDPRLTGFDRPRCANPNATADASRSGSHCTGPGPCDPISIHDLVGRAGVAQSVRGPTSEARC
jgi:hypothetical protein